MIKMLIIADDFTGALDTGVKFSTAGAKTKVVMDMEIDFHQEVPEEVLVLCAPTRHLPAKQAYDTILKIVRRAAQAKIGCIYKKTDSALRGNIGAELSAALDGSGEKAIFFIPALPAMNRITLEGTHYIDGIPVAQSVFGQDPFEPVEQSYIPDLLHQQCDVPVHVISREGMENIFSEELDGICVFDCTSKADMEKEVQLLADQNCLHLLAGCSGLAESLPDWLGLTSTDTGEKKKSLNKLMVICGSVNPISCCQLDYGEHCGYRRIHISAENLLETGEKIHQDGNDPLEYLWNAYRQSEYLMIDSLQGDGEQVVERTSNLTLEEIRQRISRSLGRIIKGLLDRGADSRILIIGGDTLLAFLEAIRCTELTPVRELQPGVVLSLVTYQGKQYEVLSKSGGFGEENLLETLQEEYEVPKAKRKVSN